MTSESQNSWRHGIDREPSDPTPRLSFTTRHIFAFAVVIQAFIFYPFTIKLYSTEDYIAELAMKENEKNNKFRDNEKAITALPEII